MNTIIKSNERKVVLVIYRGDGGDVRVKRDEHGEMLKIEVEVSMLDYGVSANGFVNWCEKNAKKLKSAEDVEDCEIIYGGLERKEVRNSD